MDKPILVPSLPASWYHSNVHFLQEKELLFKKEWIFFCHAQELPDKGDYITADVMGIPVIALRDEEGIIQIVLNVCRHRGAPLLTEKKGHLDKPLLKCTYHGWCYRTDGSFKQAPYITSTSEYSDLKKISYSEARGMIFVSFNSNPNPFELRKENICKEMDAAQFKIEDYSYHSQIRREGSFNWKIWVEGFQECYHCPTIHPIFNKDFQLSKYKVENKDHFSVHQCPRKEQSSTGTFEGLWLWLFPNCGLPCYEKVYYSLRINPITATRTELIYTFFTHAKFQQEDENTFFDFVEKITDEDIKICELVQKNLESISGMHPYDHGYLHTSRENGVQYFHELVKKALEPSLNHKMEKVPLTLS